MFEKDIKEIKEKIITSLKVYKQIEKFEKQTRILYDEKKIFDCYYNNKRKYNIYNCASRALCSIVNRKLGYDVIRQQSDNLKEFKQLVNRVRKIKRFDVLTKIYETINNKNWYYSKPEIKKDVVIIPFQSYNIGLLLNAINLLIKNELEEYEVIEKAIKALEKSNTFVYRETKITFYKNGKAKLVFTDNCTLGNFKKLIKIEAGA